MIYFIQHLEDRYIKIGTTTNLAARLAQLYEEYGKEHLRLLGIMDGTKERERQLHQEYKHKGYWRFGEWFRPEPELLTFIEYHTRPFVPEDQEKRRESLTQAQETQRRIRHLYYTNPQGLSDSEIAARLTISRMTVYRHRQQLQAVHLARGRYTLIPGPEDISEALLLLRAAISSSQISPHVITHALSPDAHQAGYRVQ